MALISFQFISKPKRIFCSCFPLARQPPHFLTATLHLQAAMARILSPFKQQREPASFPS